MTMRLFPKPRTPDEPAPERRPSDLPSGLATLEPGESLLASAQDDQTGHWLLLTTWRLLERAEDGSTALDLPWFQVDTGAWDPDEWTLRASFVGEEPDSTWTLRRSTGPGKVPEAFRDRTTASVVLVRAIDLGWRRTARVVIRTDLRSRELLEQVILDPATDPKDQAVRRQVHVARQELRGQVGLPPVPEGPSAEPR